VRRGRAVQRAAGALAALAAAAAVPCAASVFWNRAGGRAPDAAPPAAPRNAALPSRAGRAPAPWPFADIPAPAQLSPSFAIGGNGTDFAMAAGRSGAPARTAAAALRAALAAGGWTAAEPTEDFDGASFWTRGTFVALASATPAADGDGCVWLVARRVAVRGGSR